MPRRIVTYVQEFGASLWILSAGWFASALGFGISLTFLAVFLHERYGMSATDIGLFFGVMAISRSIFQVVGGELSDRMNRKTLVVFAQSMRSLAFLSLAIGIWLDLGVFVVGVNLVFIAVFGAAFQSTANALVSDLLPESKRLDGYAIVRAAGNLGWAVGPAMGGLLLDRFNYATLFVLSGVVLIISASIFHFFFNTPETTKSTDRFSFKDLADVRKDPRLLRHVLLIFALYLVVAQLMSTLALYTVDWGGISKIELGWLYTINGLLVVALQIPVVRMMGKMRLTSQLALGAIFYVVGYGFMGFADSFMFFAALIVVVTSGEVIMSPASLTLTSRLAPAGRMGRYMGIYGFFVSSGWSLGPLYGGSILDALAGRPVAAWAVIASLALFASIGYLWFGRRLPDELNLRKETT